MGCRDYQFAAKTFETIAKIKQGAMLNYEAPPLIDCKYAVSLSFCGILRCGFGEALPHVFRRNILV